MNFAKARYTDAVSPANLGVVHLQHRYGVAIVGQVVIAVWEDESVPTLEMFRELVDTVQRLRRGPLQNELIILCIVAERAGVPEPALRKIGAEGLLLSDLFVVVHEGGGFRAALVRAIFSTGALTMRARSNLQITANVAEAAALIARCAVSRRVDASVLDACVRELRSLMFLQD